MRKKIGIIGVLCLAVALAFIPIGIMQANAIRNTQEVTEEKVLCEATLDDDFADSRVAVVLKNSASLKFKKYKSSDFSDIGCISVEDLSTAAADDIKERSGQTYERVNESARKYHQILSLEIGERSKENVLSVIKKLEKRDEILYAGPDYKISLENCESKSAERAEQSKIIDKPINPGFLIEPETIPNDEYRNKQWAINKIQLPKAWNYTTGSSSVVVGVIDSGVDYTHPDLDDKIVTSLSYDFVENTSILPNPEDIDVHGTIVSGIIAAETNNGIGIAGTSWNVKIASLRVFNKYGGGSKIDVARAIDFAKQNGIKILNYSGGGAKEELLLKAAIENYKGVFVCAAGNDSSNNDEYVYYPANYNYYSNLISVGASDSNDSITDFSNYGKNNVDLFAPGEDIYSTIFDAAYQNKNGTSVAAPYVTGVAALLLSEYPSLTAAQIKTAIVDNVDKVSALSDYCKYGGRLNAFKALNSLHTTHEYGRCYSYYSTTQHASYCPCLKVYNLEPHWAYNSSIRMYNGHRYATCACCKRKINIDNNAIITLPDPNFVGELETMGLKVIGSRAELMNEICTLTDVSEYSRVNEILSYYDDFFFEKYNIVIADDTDKSDVIENLHTNIINVRETFSQKGSILFSKDCNCEEAYT